MLAVKNSDYLKYGCVHCGCEYCYNRSYYGNQMIVKCGECGVEFFVMHDDLKVSSVGFDLESFQGYVIPKKNFEKESIYEILSSIDFTNPDIQKKFSYGIGLEERGWVYLICNAHPREGILKHKLVVPDIRPEEGEYCFPRGVGYDLACFVKSREAGERITEMIHSIDPSFDAFHCHLDYREDEPLWIQVKIQYKDRLRAQYLCDLIQNNQSIITHDLIHKSLSIPSTSLVEKYHKNKVYKKNRK